MSYVKIQKNQNEEILGISYGCLLSKSYNSSRYKLGLILGKSRMNSDMEQIGEILTDVYKVMLFNTNFKKAVGGENV